MGWASGSQLAEEIWEVVGKHIPSKNKKQVAKKLIDLFEDSDCDTIDEAEDLCKAAGRSEEDY